jgi:hypothetical protein
VEVENGLFIRSLWFTICYSNIYNFCN